MSAKIVQLAPMLGLIDAPFMNAISKIGGFDEMFAPYILADGKSLARRRVLMQRFENIDKSVNLVPQLLSNSVEGFLHYANELYELGYQKVSWNMGCPQPFVTERNRGAGMLRDLQKTASLIEAVLPKLKPQLSIKIRLGYSSSDEFMQALDMFNQFEINELVVHARTAIQQYSGVPDKKTFGIGAKKSRNPIVYNGDIISVSDVSDLQQFELKGFMVGRGAISNPFIGLQIKGEPCTECPEKFRTFCMEIHDSYMRGKCGSINRLKELWKFFSKAFVGENQIFDIVKRVGDAHDLEAAVNQIFDRFELKSF